MSQESIWVVVVVVVVVVNIGFPLAGRCHARADIWHSHLFTWNVTTAKRRLNLTLTQTSPHQAQLSAHARSPSIALLPSNSLHNSLYILNLNALKDRIAL